MKFNPPQE